MRCYAEDKRCDGMYGGYRSLQRLWGTAQSPVEGPVFGDEL